MATEYNPKDYSPILRDFASYKATIAGCSHQTVNEYMRDIRAFFQFIIADRTGIDPQSDTEGFIKIGVNGKILEEIYIIQDNYYHQ